MIFHIKLNKSLYIYFKYTKEIDIKNWSRIKIKKSKKSNISNNSVILSALIGVELMDLKNGSRIKMKTQK